MVKPSNPDPVRNANLTDPASLVWAEAEKLPTVNVKQSTPRVNLSFRSISSFLDSSLAVGESRPAVAFLVFKKAEYYLWKPPQIFLIRFCEKNCSQLKLF